MEIFNSVLYIIRGNQVNPHDLGLGKAFLDMTVKVTNQRKQEINLTYSKFKTFVLQMTLSRK